MFEMRNSATRQNQARSRGNAPSPDTLPAPAGQPISRDSSVKSRKEKEHWSELCSHVHAFRRRHSALNLVACGTPILQKVVEGQTTEKSVLIGILRDSFCAVDSRNGTIFGPQFKLGQGDTFDAASLFAIEDQQNPQENHQRRPDLSKERADFGFHLAEAFGQPNS